MLDLNLTLHIQYTNKRPTVNLSIYQILKQTEYFTLNVNSEPLVPYKVYTQTSVYQTVNLANTIQNTISYPEIYFWTSHSIYLLKTNVRISNGRFTKYHKNAKSYTESYFWSSHSTLNIHTSVNLSIDLFTKHHKNTMYTPKAFAKSYIPFSIHILTSNCQSVHLTIPNKNAISYPEY
jgi:hypothetical protein